MKKLIILPFLLISAFCFSQTIDTLLGIGVGGTGAVGRGKIIKDTSLTIDGNYLFIPSRNHLSFDSSKLIWFLTGSKVYTDFRQVGIGSRTPRAKFMISDSTGATGSNDSTGIMLVNDTTALSPSITITAKANNSVAGAWQKSGFMLYSNTLTDNPQSAVLHLKRITNSVLGADVFSIATGGTSTFANAITATGTSSFTAVSTPTLTGVTNLTLSGGTAVFGISETGPVNASPAGGGYSITSAINTATTGTWNGIYINPTLTNYPNVTTTAFQNETTRNLFNSTRDNTGIGVTSIDRSAKLQVQSTAQGVLFPVMTQLQRDSIGRAVTSVTVTNGGTGAGISTTTGKLTFSAGAITAKGTFTTNASQVITSVTVTDGGSYGTGQTPVTVTQGAGSGAVLTPVLGASSPATGLTVFCSNCTATDSSTGVYQTWNGSAWKNWW